MQDFEYFFREQLLCVASKLRKVVLQFVVILKQHICIVHFGVRFVCHCDKHYLF